MNYREMAWIFVFGITFCMQLFLEIKKWKKKEKDNPMFGPIGNIIMVYLWFVLLFVNYYLTKNKDIKEIYYIIIGLFVSIYIWPNLITPIYY